MFQQVCQFYIMFSEVKERQFKYLQKFLWESVKMWTEKEKGKGENHVVSLHFTSARLQSIITEIHPYNLNLRFWLMSSNQNPNKQNKLALLFKIKQGWLDAVAW